jgi:hypothetical protein
MIGRELRYPSGNGLVRSRKLLNQAPGFCSLFLLATSARIQRVIVSYGSGKDLHSLRSLFRLNQLDGTNGSDRTLAVGALTCFHHLLNDLSLLLPSQSVTAR